MSWLGGGVVGAKLRDAAENVAHTKSSCALGGGVFGNGVGDAAIEDAFEDKGYGVVFDKPTGTNVGVLVFAFHYIIVKESSDSQSTKRGMWKYG